jgi:hypothetical protein
MRTTVRRFPTPALWSWLLELFIIYLLKMLYYYYYYYYYIIIMALQPFVGPWQLFSVSWSYTQSVGHLGGGSARRKASVYTQNNTNRINAQRHPCLEWDSNPRAQRSSERRQFMSYLLDRAATMTAMVADSSRKWIVISHVLFYYFLSYTIHTVGLRYTAPRYNGSDVPGFDLVPKYNYVCPVVQISMECFSYSIRLYCNSPCCNMQARGVKSTVRFE